MLRWAASLSTKVASTLSDTLAPLWRSPLEQLQDAWKKAEAECHTLLAQTNADTREQGGRDTEDPRILMDSPLCSHLNQIVEALMREEEDQSLRSASSESEGSSSLFDASSVGGGKEGVTSATGPCFEYLLHAKIIDKLCALGCADLVTKTLDAILQHTSHPLLPSMSVHIAVRQLLEVCYAREDHKRRGYRSAFLSLLHTIASKIKHDNSIVGIFLDIYPPSMNKKPEFLLFTALCALMSESSDGAKAYEALMWIVQLPNAAVCEYVLSSSSFVSHTLTSLCNLFRALPPALESPLMDHLVSASAEEGGVVGEGVSMFFRRWVYVDTLLRTSSAELAQALQGMLLREFLGGIVEPMLLDKREAVAIWTTNAIKHLCINAEAQRMRHTLMTFMIGNNVAPEQAPPTAALVPSSSTPPAVSTDSPSTGDPIPTAHNVRSVLLRRLDSLNDVLCLHTLDLFQTLIALRDPLIMHNLVLRNMQQPAHTSASSPSSSSSFSSPSSPSSSMDITPLPQHVMFAHFVDLPLFAPASLEEYLLDSQYEAQLWMQAWGEGEGAATIEGLGGAGACASSATASPSASSSSPFFEGLFLSTLLNKLDSLYENSFAINLKLTAVLATLSYCPAPSLHHFMFNPEFTVAHTPHTAAAAAHTTATAGGEVTDESKTTATAAAAAAATPDIGSVDSAPRTVLQVLCTLWNKGMKRAARIPHFARKKEEIRHRLNQCIQPNAQQQASVELDGERFVRGVILLEEFLLEFFAISQTKARLFELTKGARLAAATAAAAAASQVHAQAQAGTPWSAAAAFAAMSSPRVATPSAPPKPFSPMATPVTPRQAREPDLSTTTPIKSPLQDTQLAFNDDSIALSPAPAPQWNAEAETSTEQAEPAVEAEDALP